MTEQIGIHDVIDYSTLMRLVDQLGKVALGEITLTSEQTEALMFLVDKAIPDLKPESLEEALMDEQETKRG